MVLYTSLSNAGFICALPVVVTPLLEWLFLQEAAGSAAGGGAGAVYRGHGAYDPQRGAAPGAGRYHLPAVRRSYAGDLVLTDRAVQSAGQRPAQLGILQLGVVGFVMLGLSPSCWRSPCHRPLPCGATPVSGGVLSAWASSSRRCSSSTPPPAMWGLIFTLEPVFSAIVRISLPMRFAAAGATSRGGADDGEPAGDGAGLEEPAAPEE